MDQRIDQKNAGRENVRHMKFSRWTLFIVLSIAMISGVFVLRASYFTPQSRLLKEGTAEQILDQVRSLHSPLVLINFWASWCEPCKAEFPSILEIKREFAARGLQVVFVSVDGPEDLPAAERFLMDQNVDFKSFYKGNQSLNFVSKIFPGWSGAVPASVLLGQDLRLMDAWEGDSSLEEFRQRIEKHLKGI